MMDSSSFRFAAALMLLISLSLPAAGPATRDAAVDTDGDGIGDALEQALGCNPEVAETLTLVHHDPTLAEGDRTHANRKAVPDMTDVWFGNVAQNRWLWRIDFADAFEGTGTNVLLYVDADNDPATGRQGGATGTDVRLMYHNGGPSLVIQNSRVLSRDRSLRSVAVGHSVYFCMDLNVNLNDEGECDFRARLLCQLSAAPADSDMADWFPLRNVRPEDRPKCPVGTLSQMLSEGMHVRRPWLGWRRDLAAAGSTVLDPREAAIKGMTLFNAALEPVEDGAVAAWKLDTDGSRFVNILIQDSAAGEECVELKLSGEVLGTCVAVQNDGDLYLYTTAEPITIERGATLEVCAAHPAQDFRICEVSLSSSRPAPPPLRIHHVETYCSPLQTGGDVWVDVCFLTSYPCIAGVRYGTGLDLDQRLEETDATYNHRLRIPALPRGTEIRIAPFAGYGDESVSLPVQVVTASPVRLANVPQTDRRVKLFRRDVLPARSVPWPVSSGVPIPRGELRQADTCRLLTAEGQPIPADMDELAFWPDGSVKWLLVNTVLPPERDEAVLQVVNAPQEKAPPQATPAVQAGADTITVRTDMLRCTMSRSRFVPLGELRVDTDGDGRFAESERLLDGTGPGIRMVDDEGNDFTSAGGIPTRFEVEKNGPVRTVVCVEGPLTGASGKHLSYQCRMTFMNGFPGAQMVLSLCVDEGKTIFPPTLHRIRSLTVPLQTAARVQSPVARRVQDDDQRFVETGAGGGATVRDGHMPGALAVSVGDVPVSLAIRNAWQLYPKGFSSASDSLTVEAFPELPADRYADKKDPKLLTMNYYWFRDGAYLLPCGTRPSTDVLFYVGDVPEDRLSACWDNAPALAPAPEYIAETGAFFDLEPEKDGVFEDFKAFVRNGFEKLETNRRNQHWYSWMNYGDWYGERSVNWGNQEYDMQWGLLVQYARSADPRFLVRAETAARHTACIDQITWSPEPARLGIQKEHALWHVGGFDTPRIEGARFWFNNGIYNTGHMWSLGSYGVYWLTGDRRMKDATDLLSGWMADRYCRYLERWVHRNYGWSTLVVLGAYYTEPHPYYLNAARLFMENVVSRQDPGTGAFVHPIGECTHTPRHMGGKTFMSGVEMCALKHMDRLEPDDAYKRALCLTADWMHTRMWHPDKAGFQYAQCPNFDNGASSSGVNMACEGLAYAYDLAGNQAYRDMLVQSLARMVTPTSGSGSGKGYAMQIRMTPYAFSAMQRWGMTALPDAADRPPQVRVAPQIYIGGGQGKLVVTATSESRASQRGVARIVSTPSGVTVTPSEVTWDVPRGLHTSPPFDLRCSPDADGSVVKIAYQVGDASGTCEVRITVGERLRLGDRVGYVGGPEDPVGLALRTLGITLLPIERLEPDALRNVHSLLVGSEAHEKGYGGLPALSRHILDFVHAGGRVAVLQVQNTSYQDHFLPAPIAFSNEKSALKDSVRPQHPLFTTPNSLHSLAGVVSYDTVVSADPAWSVLATDRQGRPSIVETTFGAGRILLVQPSPDRYVVGTEAPVDDATAATCAAFLQNIVAYLSRSPDEPE
jgi:hypothetical protein